MSRPPPPCMRPILRKWCCYVRAVTHGVKAYSLRPMRVLLVHGLGRTPASLWGLSRALREAGHEPGFVGYVAAVERFEAIRSRVRRRLLSAAASGASAAAMRWYIARRRLRSPM
mgnify:CR=1 FL=1